MPAIPILSPPSKVHVIPCSTRGASSLYRIYWTKTNWVNSLEPRISKGYIVRNTCKYLYIYDYLQISKLHPTNLGPVWCGRFSSMASAASLGMSMYWFTLSTEIIWFDSWHWFWIEKTKELFRDRPQDNVIPTEPAHAQNGVVSVSDDDYKIFITWTMPNTCSFDF
jgi:hypothetical protein